MLLTATTQAGRAVRRSRGGLRPPARPVGARDEPRRRRRRRRAVAAEDVQPGRAALRAAASRAAARGDAVPQRERLHHAELRDQAGDPSADRAGRHARSDQDQPAARAGDAARRAAHRRAWSSRKRSTAPTAYRPTEFFTDLRRAVWREVDGASVQIDPYRRNLQRAYLDAMSDKVNSRVSGESRPLARGELRTLDTSRARGDRARRPTARRGCTCRTCGIRSRRILDPKFAPTDRAAESADHLRSGRSGRAGRLLVRLRDSRSNAVEAGL